MEKRIAALSNNPHTVSLTDRKCSLFIDPKCGSTFVDEGDGEGRMNGVVFSPANEPSFTVEPSAGPDHELILHYCGVQYKLGVSEDGGQLQSWAESANSLLVAKGKQAGAGEQRRSCPPKRTKVQPPLGNATSAYFEPLPPSVDTRRLEYVEC